MSVMYTVILLIMGCVLVKYRRAFTNDATIAEVERDEAARREMKKKRAQFSDGRRPG